MIYNVIHVSKVYGYFLFEDKIARPDKAKFTVCSIIKLATIAFDETSSYWSAPKSSLFLGFSLVATRLSDYYWSAFRNH